LTNVICAKFDKFVEWQHDVPCRGFINSLHALSMWWHSPSQASYFFSTCNECFHLCEKNEIKKKLQNFDTLAKGVKT
jgi:hypothetical protein